MSLKVMDLLVPPKVWDMMRKFHQANWKGDTDHIPVYYTCRLCGGVGVHELVPREEPGEEFRLQPVLNCPTCMGFKRASSLHEDIHEFLLRCLATHRAWDHPRIMEKTNADA